MPPQDMPPAEVEIDASTVRKLLEAQQPHLAGLEVTRLANGWDNVSFRIGDAWVARLPRRAVAVDLVGHEASWLPGLAHVLPLPVPAPVFVGSPGEGYPWPWLIVPFLTGTTVATSEHIDLVTCARQLGEFLAALHRVAPRDAPSNPFRGVPLASRDAATRERLAMLGDPSRADGLLRVWEEALATPPHALNARWLHGDLHPHNILTETGQLSGVIDFGDITSGDPATDLSVAYMMFEPGSRRLFRSAYGDDDHALWGRARGWAASLATAYLAHSADNPIMRDIGSRTVSALLSEA